MLFKVQQYFKSSFCVLYIHKYFCFLGAETRKCDVYRFFPFLFKLVVLTTTGDLFLV